MEAKGHKKGIILIGLGLLLLVVSDWITTRIITLAAALAFINYGLLQMGKPSLMDYARTAFNFFNFKKNRD